MATTKQLKANKKNAQLSTGPRSQEGKAKSAMNAVKHALTAQSIVLPNESAEELVNFATVLRASLAPVDGVDELLVDMFAIRGWKCRRAPVFEARLHARARKEARETKLAQEAWNSQSRAQLSASRRDEAERSIDDDHANAKHDAIANEIEDDPPFDATVTFDHYARQLENLGRYEDRNERSMLRILDHLARRRMERAAKPVATPARPVLTLANIDSYIQSSRSSLEDLFKLIARIDERLEKARKK